MRISTFDRGIVMNLIRLTEDRVFEVVKEYSKEFLQSIGKERTMELFTRLGIRGCDAVIKNPENGNYMFCREVVESNNIQNKIEEPLKKKRGRPKGSKNKPKVIKETKDGNES